MNNRILIVDDEASIRRLLRSILQDAGYQCQEAVDVADARQQLARESFDLMITDLNMPGESGLDLMRHVRRQGLNMGVVIATIIDNPMEAEKVLEAAPYGYIVKPFTRNLVMITVANALRRHRLEQQEKASRQALESKMQLLLDNIPLGLLLINRDLVIEEVNTRMQEWFPLLIPGSPMANQPELAGTSKHSLHQALKETFGHGRTNCHQAQVITSLGPREFALTLLPTASSKEDSAQACIMVFDDITEKNSLERELLQAQKMEAIGQLAAGVAHEINTPVQYVGDNLQFLADGFSDLASLIEEYERLCRKGAELTIEEMAKQLTRLKQEADQDYLQEEIPRTISQSLEGVGRIASIVKAMREFSHPGSSEKTPTDLNHALQNTIIVSRNEWKYVAELTTALDPGLPSIPCLAGELNQVFLNLIINASHTIGDKVRQGVYTKGLIHVATRVDNSYAYVEISDNGMGIPKKVQHRVFDPFFTTKAVGKGTGQGLTIARNIVVDKHGGQLTFTTTQEQGTRFEIRLPLKPTS